MLSVGVHGIHEHWAPNVMSQVCRGCWITPIHIWYIPSLILWCPRLVSLTFHPSPQVPLTNRILSYSESGYIQDLSRKYLSRPNCEGLLANSAVKYGLEHTGGLFIILSSTLVLSVLLVCLEHCAYRYIVPWIRRQPATSWWKTEGLAFISQVSSIKEDLMV